MNAATTNVPQPITAGPEMEALMRFHRDVTWAGRIAPGGMGPDTPEMVATGWGRHEGIQEGRWVVGTYEQDQFLLDGSFVLRWQLHWVAGWSPMFGEYRATIADNYGNADVMRGNIDGNRLTFESLDDDRIVRIRLTWDLVDEQRVVWRNEMSVGGAPWTLVEEYECEVVRSEEGIQP